MNHLTSQNATRSRSFDQQRAVVLLVGSAREHNLSRLSGHQIANLNRSPAPERDELGTRFVTDSVTSRRIWQAGGDDLTGLEIEQRSSDKIGWHDNATYEPTELPVPESISDGQVIADGRLLVFRPADTWASSIFDLQSGEVIASSLEDISAWTTTVGPNNEMIAYMSDGTLTLKNLETGTEYEVEFEGGGSPDFPGQLLVATP